MPDPDDTPLSALDLPVRDETIGPLPDILAPDLDVIFCGINPGLHSARAGHHYAGPGNRFWATLDGAGFTPRRLQPCEDRILPRFGVGLTNLVARETARADELSTAELRAGAIRLRVLCQKWRPRAVAFVGLGAFRTGFRRPRAPIGELLDPTLELTLSSRVWLLPSTSGLNGHYQLDELTRLFSELRAALAQA